VLHKNRYKDQGNGIEDPDTKAIWSLTNEPKTYTGEKTASSTNDAGKTGYLHEEDWE
jgi:hypothetical protein